MKTVVIANPHAGAGSVRRHWATHHAALIAAFGPLEVQFTTGPRDAVIRTREVLRAGARRVVAVGGDGTFNEVVNGFFAEDGEFLGEQATFVPYPAGTGDDFARSVGLAGRPFDAALSTERRIDVGRARVTGPDGRPVIRYFLNISSFGASGLVVEKVNTTTKIFGAKLSFQIGTIRGLFGFRNTPVRLVIDDCFDQVLTINTVVVANARYFGGGMQVAPSARVDDGLLDVTIFGDIGPIAFASKYVGAMYEAAHLTLPEVTTLRGRVIEASVPSDAEVLVDADGEQPGRLPIRYDVLPSQLDVCAPWQHAETTG